MLEIFESLYFFADEESEEVMRIIGGIAPTLLAILSIFFYARGTKRKRLIEDTPTSTVKGVFIGLNEMKGTAVLVADMFGYLSEKPCCYYSYSIEEHYTRTRTVTDKDGNTRTQTYSGWETVASGSNRIEFDLVDVLKHLVEEVGIDINAYEWNSYTYEGPKRIHLLASAFYRENCFQYLIKRGDLDVFSYFFHPGHGDGSREDLFQVALRFEDIKHSVFQAIVCHGNFDPNTPRRQEDDGPFPGLLLRPLQFALACIDEGHFDEDIDEMEEKFKILLTETGADPSLDTADCPSAIDFALKTFTLANHKHRERWSRIISAMKQRHPNLAVPDRLERRYRDLSRFSPY